MGSSKKRLSGLNLKECQLALWYHDWYSADMNSQVSHNQKVTVQLPKDLIQEAMKGSGDNLTATIRQGLQLIAAKRVYEGLRKRRGKVKFSINLKELRKDRR